MSNRQPPMQAPRQRPGAIPPHRLRQRQIRGDSQWVKVVPRQQARVQPPRVLATPMPVSRSPAPAHPPQERPLSRPQSIQGSGRLDSRSWAIIAGLGFVVITLFTCAAMTLGVGLVYAGGILPGVQVAGLSVGGMSSEDAAQKIAAEWDTVILRDGDRTFRVSTAALGIAVDAQRSAAQAYETGRGDGSPIEAMLGTVSISPAMTIDVEQLRRGLEQVALEVDIPPVDAGVQIVNGQVAERPPQAGRLLDVGAALALFADESEVADGVIDLTMVSVQPNVIDASAVVQAAASLLSRPLDINVYDPVTGDTVAWRVDPTQWAEWITATSDPSSSIGVSLSIQDEPLRDYLVAQSAVFDETRYIDVSEAVSAVRFAVAQNDTSPVLRVRHRERQHVVRSGESITSIAWDYGIPYPYIQDANNNISGVSIGQTITIPPADIFLDYDPIASKRVVVSISQQRVWVYENDALIWEWVASTGINDSPTWPGVYQILSFETNAYAGNWDLNMPWFMGVYRPIPGSDFTNGFHGFPTRGGGQLLWENSLGRKVTYGCILLSNTNVQLLWDWAETGVVVEIQA